MKKYRLMSETPLRPKGSVLFQGEKGRGVLSKEEKGRALRSTFFRASGISASEATKGGERVLHT